MRGKNVRRGAATRRIRRLEAVWLASAWVMHTARKAITPPLLGQRQHTTIISTATYSPWLVDADFLRVAATIDDNTLLDHMRLYELWQLADQVGHLEGDGIEVGCWRGGAGCMVAQRLARSAPDVTMFLCDTFTGVVKAGAQDSVYVGGEHRDADEQTVRRLADRMGLTNVQ